MSEGPVKGFAGGTSARVNRGASRQGTLLGLGLQGKQGQWQHKREKVARSRIMEGHIDNVKIGGRRTRMGPKLPNCSR